MDIYIYKKSIQTCMRMINSDSRGVLPLGTEEGKVVELGLS